MDPLKQGQLGGTQSYETPPRLGRAHLTSTAAARQLREIAKELGLSHQRVHQMVSGETPRPRKLPRAAGGIAGVLVTVAATFGALRIAHAPPFVQTDRVPPAKSYHEIRIDPTTGHIVNVRLVPNR